jgi:2-polyprenyl-3-methyl-5-hydroxy-6-metoxy-1,4-benzoquinol methylase
VIEITVKHKFLWITLTHYLNLPEKAKVLDLACGKGRHSIYLNQLGFNVLGADLSENSIDQATLKNTNSNNLRFEHDMRNHLKKNLMLFLTYLPVLVILK